MRPKPSMTLDGFVAPSCTRSWVCPCRAVFHIGFRLVHRSALVSRAGEVDPGHMRVHATVEWLRSTIYSPDAFNALHALQVVPPSLSLSGLLSQFLGHLPISPSLNQCTGCPLYYTFSLVVRPADSELHHQYQYPPNSQNRRLHEFQNGFPSDPRSSRRPRCFRRDHSWSVGIW